MASLEWKRAGAWWLDGGTHTVSKDGGPTSRYLAWRKAQPMAVLLGVFATAEEAKGECERDRAKATVAA